MAMFFEWVLANSAIPQDSTSTLLDHLSSFEFGGGVVQAPVAYRARIVSVFGTAVIDSADVSVVIDSVESGVSVARVSAGGVVGSV